MIVSELIRAAHIKYKGNLRVPAVGSDKYSIYLALANLKQREWARDPYVDWGSLYSNESIGTVSVSSLSYDLPTEVLRAAEYVYLDIDGSLNPFDIVKPAAAQQNLYNAVFIAGKILTFTATVPTRLAGASLIVPAYYMPDDLVGASDEIAVDDPDWLVTAVAAELARNDYSKDDQFGNLAGQANDLYDRMKTANDSAPYLQDGTIPYDVQVMGI